MFVVPVAMNSLLKILGKVINSSVRRVVLLILLTMETMTENGSSQIN